MRYSALGATGLQVSAVGFGSMRLPMTNIGNVDFVDLDRSVEVIRHALSSGINYVDCGFQYGNMQSEIAVGRAIRGRREQVIITGKATKTRMFNPGDMRRMLDHQLSRLEIDHFDFYGFHGIGWDNLHAIDEKTGWIAQMHQARQEGLMKHLCFSFHDVPEAIPRLVDLGWFDLITCQYNYMDRRNEEGIAYAAEKGLGVCVMGPVGGGRLACLPPPVQERLGIDEAQAVSLALRFVLANPHVNCALSGMGSAEMIDHNASVVDGPPLSGTERADLVRLLDELQELASLYCTGCNYCAPCPHGVNIARRFELMNQHRIWGLTERARAAYQQLVARESEGQCQECGECLPKCPQQIAIIEQLKETAAALGTAQ
ncbi:MAG: aldo/keto reductase [Candidatus Latescibacterota bacterium]